LFYSQADHTRTFVLRQGGAEQVRRLTPWSSSRTA